MLDTEMSNNHKIFLLYKSSGKRVGTFKAELAFFSFKKDKILKSLVFSVRKIWLLKTLFPCRYFKMKK